MRLGVKLMESDVVAYDHTVRDGTGHIVQFAYNGNGLDPRHNACVGSDSAIVDIRKTIDTSCL